MNILMLTHHFYPFKGGVSTHKTSEALNLMKRGHKIFVITPINPPSYKETNFKTPNYQKYKNILIHPINPIFKIFYKIRKLKTFLLSPRFLIESIKTIKSYKINAIEIETTFTRSFSHAIVVFLLRHLFGIKIILSIHGYDFICPISMPSDRNCQDYYSFTKCLKCLKNPSLIIKWNIARRLSWNSIDRAYVKYKSLFDAHSKLGYSSKLTIIHYWVNTSLFFPNPNEETRIPNSIIHVGSLDPYKGIKFLLNGFLDAYKIDPTLKLILIGEGFFKNYIHNLISKKNLTNTIKLLGNVPHKKIPSYFRKAHIALFTSPIANFNWTFSEALCCGMPIITSNTSDLSEIIQNNVNGILTDFGEIKELGKKILELIKNQELRETLGKNAHKTGSQLFDLNSNIAKLETLFIED